MSAAEATRDERDATVALDSSAHEGELIPADLFVAGLQEPVKIADAITVIGPLPEIVSVQQSFPSEQNVELFPGEIPAGTVGSFLLQTKHAGSHPTLELACQGSSDWKRIPAGGSQGAAVEFDPMGAESYYLSLDPGGITPSPCMLTAAIDNSDTGVSPAVPLGRVVLIPRIDTFSLSEEQQGKGLYVGTVTGQNLQEIRKTGWNSRIGYAVAGIPVPIAGPAHEQSLTIELPWPPPSPQAPLYIWLEGELQGRRTAAKY